MLPFVAIIIMGKIQRTVSRRKVAAGAAMQVLEKFTKHCSRVVV